MALKKQVVTTTTTKTKNGKNYCTFCDTTQTEKNFFESDSIINKTGVMHVCKVCCNNLFDKVYREYKKLDEFEVVNSTNITFTKNTERAFEKTCRYLDLPFNYHAYEQLISHVQTSKNNGTVINAIFGVYKSKLSTTSKRNGRNVRQVYDFGDKILEDDDKEKLENENICTITEKDLYKMQIFWGKGLNRDDYEFLETELSDWKVTHKCDNKAELTLLKEICLKELDIRKAREDGRDVGSLQKGLQELMKTASVDPAKSNSLSTGRAVDSYGAWVKDIEDMSPAEWHEKQEKYKDMDGILTYLDNYVKRPILNFLSGSRNFELIDEKFDGSLDDEDGDDS